MPECQSPECDKTFEQPKVGPPKLYCDQRCRATARRRSQGVPKKVYFEGDRKEYEREYHRKRRRRLGIPERKPRMTGEELAAAKERWNETRKAKRRAAAALRPPRPRRERTAPAPRRERTVSGTVLTPNAKVHVRREPELPKLPLELSQAWGRAGYGSQMKRKYPTRESLLAAFRRGEVPIPSAGRMETCNG